MNLECAYCSDEAIGYDAEDAPTCGNEATCTPAVRPQPRVVEVSGDDDDDEVEEG